MVRSDSGEHCVDSGCLHCALCLLRVPIQAEHDKQQHDIRK